MQHEIIRQQNKANKLIMDLFFQEERMSETTHELIKARLDEQRREYLEGCSYGGLYEMIECSNEVEELKSWACTEITKSLMVEFIIDNQEIYDNYFN